MHPSDGTLRKGENLLKKLKFSDSRGKFRNAKTPLEQSVYTKEESQSIKLDF